MNTETIAFDVAYAAHPPRAISGAHTHADAVEADLARWRVVAERLADRPRRWWSWIWRKDQ